jgi:hypothetical protein
MTQQPGVSFKFIKQKHWSLILSVCISVSVKKFQRLDFLKPFFSLFFQISIWEIKSHPLSHFYFFIRIIEIDSMIP